MRYILRDSALSPITSLDPALRRDLKTLSQNTEENRNIRGYVLNLASDSDKEFTTPLLEQFLDKCAYCETPLNSNKSIDRFRPIFGAKRNNGKVDQDYYSWLVLDWDNIYSCCEQCNVYKANNFPINGKSTFGASISKLRREEQALLIDPCFDRPDQHLEIGPDGLFFPKTAKGKTTIEILNLNRIDLCLNRSRLIEKLIRAWDKALQATFSHWPSTNLFEEVFDLLQHSTPYVGSIHLFLWRIADTNSKKIIRRIIDQGPYQSGIRSLIRSRGTLPSLNDLRITEELSEQEKALETHNFVSYRPIKSIEINGFKGIDNLKIDISLGNNRSQEAIAIVGKNASGKSSVLQALSLALIGIEEANTVIKDARKLLGSGRENASIKVDFWGTDQINLLEISNSSSRFSGKTERPIRVFGYGPYRILAKGELSKKMRSKGYRVSSLFNDSQKLNGYHGWLNRIDSKQSKDMAEVLELLMSSEDASVEVNSQSLKIASKAKIHPIESLSSGMQSIVSMCTDLMEVIYSDSDSVLSNSYLILIDELDAHLHPAWRMGIVKRLNRAFPNAQIIFSTHDPLTLRGLNREQIQILYRDHKNNEITNKRADIYSDSLDIDQILTSEIFGLHTTHSPEWEIDFENYYQLLSKQASDIRLNEDENNRLTQLRKILDGYGVFGRTKRERIMFAVIDQLLSQPNISINEWDPKVINEISTEIQSKLFEFQENID